MNNMPDLSALFSMLSNNNSNNQNSSPEEMLFNIMNSSSLDQPTLDNNTTSDNNSMPDMETIMKIMKVMNSANDSSPSKNLLISLKPFLNDTRKEKVDQYIKLMGITKFIEIFNELGGKKNE